MAYYPIFVELRDRPCLVVGGGPEAQRKVEGLLGGEAKVTVVAPKLTKPLQKMLAGGEIDCIQREYQEGETHRGTRAAVVTAEGAVNRETRDAGRSNGIWVNDGEDSPSGAFTLPAVIGRGAGTLAASTGCASPALARRLREELEAYLTEEMPALADLLKEVRGDLRSRSIVPDAEVWQEAIDEELRVLLAQRKYRQAKTRLLTSLGAEELVPELVGSSNGESA